MEFMKKYKVKQFKVLIYSTSKVFDCIFNFTGPFKIEICYFIFKFSSRLNYLLKYPYILSLLVVTTDMIHANNTKEIRKCVV